MPFATRLRPLLTACLVLVALLPLRAENWQTFTVIAPAARAQHAFTLQLNGVPHGSVSFGGEIQAWGDELAVPLTLSVDLDQTGPFTLLDTGVGEFVPLAAWWPGPPELGVGYISEHDFRPSGGQPPTRSFFVPEARRDHSLFLSQPGGGASLSVNGSSPIPYYSPTLLTTAGYEGRALFDPTLPYRITDLNTGEQTPFFATDLAYAVWSPGTGDVPMVLVTLYLEGREDAHRFTVHSRAVGGPVIVQSVQAHDGMGGMGGMGAAWPAGGGWTCGTGWSWFEVPAGSAMLSFAVGRGMEFWITREADSPPIASPHFAADDSSGAPLAWPLYGVFPIPVQRATQAVTFRVNAQRWGNQFTVWQSDGYHFRFAANDPGRVNGQPDWNGSV